MEDLTGEVAFENGPAYKAEISEGRSVICAPVVGGYAFEFSNNGHITRIALSCEGMDAMAAIAARVEMDRAGVAQPEPEEQHSLLVLP